ncbi:hypothetical protein BX070DRAFT_225379, partial [Coemansia spiralis]
MAHRIIGRFARLNIARANATKAYGLRRIHQNKPTQNVGKQHESSQTALGSMAKGPRATTRQFQYWGDAEIQKLFQAVSENSQMDGTIDWSSVVAKMAPRSLLSCKMKHRHISGKLYPGMSYL